MKRTPPKAKKAPTGPSQRQLRAGELMRHALVEILREEDFTDEEMMTITAGDVNNSAAPLLRGLGLSVPA